MHLSFGMETRNTSTRWDDVRRGPSLEEVKRHTLKLGTYGQVTGRESPTRG